MSKISDTGKIVNMILKFSKDSDWEAIVKLFVILGMLLSFFAGIVLAWRHI